LQYYAHSSSAPSAAASSSAPPPAPDTDAENSSRTDSDVTDATRRLQAMLSSVFKLEESYFLQKRRDAVGRLGLRNDPRTEMMGMMWRNRDADEVVEGNARMRMRRIMMREMMEEEDFEIRMMMREEMALADVGLQENPEILLRAEVQHTRASNTDMLGRKRQVIASFISPSLSIDTAEQVQQRVELARAALDAYEAILKEQTKITTYQKTIHQLQLSDKIFNTTPEVASTGAAGSSGGGGSGGGVAKLLEEHAGGSQKESGSQKERKISVHRNMCVDGAHSVEIVAIQAFL
jgi:hypothetical protein